MSPDDIHDARRTLAEADGYSRPYTMREFGLMIGFEGRDPGSRVREIEIGKREISGPAANVVRAMRSGWRPPVWHQWTHPEKEGDR